MASKTLLIKLFTIVLGYSSSVFAQEITPSLNSFVEKKRNYNKNSKNGVSVLLYNGQEDKARQIYEEFKGEYKGISIKLTYVSPDWKVLTPAYSSTIEAERIAIIIREKYPNAKIL
ncbi:hypothetical protein FHR24_002807 [Wenyingzhuangia heitensis]|uniref:Sporulation related domain-containing protein n=1 Tax=Wenyingzhuangia heitensis TaxID=1487859 RepID=A0ABX0UD50_9FLAO|nr:hypothetical protein [Wenyingzhuangia heitensis]NIJ46323.1 hypothetical protein [Wenyingzhuangia heitensis]